MKTLTLAPGREPKQLTAKRPSRTLGEHEEAFKSRNGYVAEPPPDTSGEINGVISEIMQLRRVTHREVLDAGRLIRQLSDKRFRLNQGAQMVWKALGYIDYQDASKRNEGKDHFENLNYDRKDLVKVNQDIADREEEIYQAVAARIRPYFEQVFALPYEKEWFSGERCKSAAQFMPRAYRYLEHLGWECGDTLEAWAFGHALAFRYPSASNIETKKGLFRRNQDYGTRKQTYEASKRLARELGWGPKPGEIVARNERLKS